MKKLVEERGRHNLDRNAYQSKTIFHSWVSSIAKSASIATASAKIVFKQRQHTRAKSRQLGDIWPLRRVDCYLGAIARIELPEFDQNDTPTDRTWCMAGCGWISHIGAYRILSIGSPDFKVISFANKKSKLIDEI